MLRECDVSLIPLTKLWQDALLFFAELATMKMQHQHNNVFVVLMTRGMIQILHSRAQITGNKIATVDEIKNYFRQKGKTVTTFTGYSSAGYQDEKSMLAKANTIRQKYNPSKTIINIGATAYGIGSAYSCLKNGDFRQPGSFQ